MYVHASERFRSTRHQAWNRCDDCGRFIPMSDFDSGKAERRLSSADTAFSCEGYVTLCAKCNRSPQEPRP